MEGEGGERDHNPSKLNLNEESKSFPLKFNIVQVITKKSYLPIIKKNASLNTEG